MNVAPGSSIRPFYEKAPIFLEFRIFVFNVTNKEEILAGGERSHIVWFSMDKLSFFSFLLEQNIISSREIHFFF